MGGNFKKVKIFAFLAFILFLTSEFYLRSNSDITRVGGRGLYLPDEDLGYKLKPSFSKMEKTKDGIFEIKINSRGLRWGEVEYRKGVGEKRVLSLGGSIPFGSGMDLKKNYVYRISQKMNDGNSKINFINGAVQGYQFGQMYDFYNQELFLYDPNVVLLSLVLDDINEVNVSVLRENVLKFDNLQKNEGFFEVLLKESCYSCVIAYKFILDREKKHFNSVINSWNDSEIYSNFAAKLGDFNKNLSEKNSSLVILIFPYKRQLTLGLEYSGSPQKKLGSLCAELNITFIDVGHYLDDGNYEDYYLVDDEIHLSEEGFEKIENIIYLEIEKKLK